MFNLKNYMWNDVYGTSAYVELAQMVIVFGLEDILHTLADIHKERYYSSIRVEGDGKRVVTIEGKDYILP